MARKAAATATRNSRRAARKEIAASGQNSSPVSMPASADWLEEKATATANSTGSANAT